MKKLIILFCLPGLLISSCKKFLDKNPTDQLSSGTFWKQKSDFDMALASNYNGLQNYYISTGIQDRDGLSDNAIDEFSYANEEQINQNINASSGNTDWAYSLNYQLLAQYNIFLQNLAGYTGTDMTSADKAKYEGEVKLLRAMAYYRLYTFYGSVPLVTVPLTLATQNVPKAPTADIFNQIVSDCDFAIANLPDATFVGAGGHFTKAAAELLEARAYLYAGYDENGNAMLDAMNKAVALTTPIINSNIYQLGKTYRGLFAYSIGEQIGNPEYIFAVNFLAPNDSKYGEYGFNISTMQFYWQSVHPLPSLLNAYEFADGTPYNPNDPRVDPKHLYKNRDPRMAATVCIDSVHWEDGTVQALGAPKYPANPYLYWKVCDEAEVKQNGGVSDQATNTLNNGSVPLMRYAEVLLSNAEAINEVSGPTNNVYTDINTIRARAKMPPLPTGLSQSQMRDAIRYERRVELSFEGFRYDDIKRWRIAPMVLNGLNDGTETRAFLPVNYVWPLPVSELRIDKALVQNPDYK